MRRSDSFQAEFQESVVIGSVISPSILLALPFLPGRLAQVAIGVGLGVLLAITLAGYLRYRRQARPSLAFDCWRLTLFTLLVVAFITLALSLAAMLGGVVGAAVLAVFFIGFLGWAWRAVPRDRITGGGAFNERIVGVACALGAGLSGVFVVLFGPAFIAFIVTLLHLGLAAIVAVLLIRASHEAGITADNGT
jgi:hypothetical protein